MSVMKFIGLSLGLAVFSCAKLAKMTSAWAHIMIVTLKYPIKWNECEDSPEYSYVSPAVLKYEHVEQI